MKLNYSIPAICIFFVPFLMNAKNKNFSPKSAIHNSKNTYTTARQNWTINPFEAKEFVENKGQFSNNEDGKNDPIIFSANVTGIKIYFNATGLTYECDKAPNVTEEQRDAVESGKKKPQDLPQVKKEFFGVQWLNANPNPTIVPEEVLSYYYTYPDGEKDNKTIIAKAYKKILYRNIYPHIDIEYSFVNGGKEGIKYAIILHSGADASKIKLVYQNAENPQVNSEGNVLMKSLFGKFVDHAPKTFYEDNTSIESSFQLNGNEVSFKLGNYDHSKKVIIDPWTTNPALTGINSAYDLDYDNNGNVYIYGGQYPYQVKKLNAAGVIQWVAAPTSASNTSAYGDFAVDHVSGTSYVGEGIDYSNARIFKVNALGVQTGVFNGTTSMIEIWRMQYNSCIKEIVIGTGNTSLPYQAAILDTNMASITPVNVFGATSGYHDICLLGIDNNGSNCYIATTQSLLGAGAGFNNTLAKCPLPTLGPTAYIVNDGYAFQEIGSITYAGGSTGTANGMNGMAASPSWLYMYDGAKLKRLNKATGAIVTTKTVTATSFQWGGLDVDQCDNVYLGNNNNIDVYDSLLNQTGTIAASGAVYDLHLAPNNLMYACGKAFVSSYTVVAPVLTINITRTPASGCAGCNGTATANLSGCGSTSTSFNYLWSNGQTTKTATGLCPGNYTVTISSNCEPINSDTVNITTVGGAGSVVVAAPPGICSGSSSTITASGSTTYSWSNGATSAAITVSPTTTTTYTVTGTSSGCTATATATVVVSPPPTMAVNSGSICSGSSIALTATGATTYSWSPGTGLSGTTGATVTANPTTTTNYTVTGTTAGCTGTTVATVTVNPNPVVTVNSATICSSSSAILTAAGATTYSWTPATGLSGTTGISVTANPATTTNYTVTGTSGTGCTGTAIATVTVYTPPTVGVNSLTICTGSSGTLIGTGAVTYSWSPAAGLSGTTGTSVTADPTTTTSYTVTGSSTAGCTGSAVATVTVNPSPTASFTSTTVCFNNATDFTDASTTTVGTITGWSWNFGEPSSGANNTSHSQNPSHTYGSSGTFNVTLVVTSSGGCVDSVTVPVVVNPLPIASFSTTAVCAGSAMTFTDGSTISSGSISSWAWNFGDPGSGVNNTSTLQSPSHTYAAAGTYTVTLTVTSNNGCQGTTTQIVTVNPIPVAAFTASTVCTGSATNFTDGSTVSTGTVTGWSWNFGDGNTSIVQNPTHTYATSGTYGVSLTVTSNGGCTNTVVDSITVLPIPTASFTATNVCLNNTSNFTDGSTVSTGTITGWNWNFGDGNTSTVQNPTHTYATSGVYVVTLTVTSSNGCSNTISQNVTVYPLPVAAFSNTTVCQNSITGFTDGSTVSSGTITTWSWNFGDGNTSSSQSPTHLYSTSGTYSVKLIVTSSNGCLDSITQNVTVNPNPVVAFTVDDSTGCAPLCVNFTDGSTVVGGTINSWLWNFGDGNTGNSQNPGHCYTAPGSYDVMLTVTSQNNCSTTYTHPDMINVYPVPVAAFTFNPQPATIDNPTLNFVDGSTGASSWHWNFGDGDSLTWGNNDNNPTHTYADTGYYNVQLIVINQFGCIDSVTHPIYIEPVFTFYAPNAFTPNGDGINDYFYGTGIGIEAYQMWIFDRWGNLIFHTTNLNDRWNGVVQGGDKQAQIDVYVWKVKLRDVFHKDHQYIGHVSLIR